MAHPMIADGFGPYTPERGPPPRASRYILYQGKEIFRGVGFVRESQRLTCPGGHRMDRRARILEDATLFCDHRPVSGHAPCGALVYVLVIPARGEKKSRLFAADCTREELALIERLGLDADQVLDYFGASFPR